ncbi:hypothetical protein F4802DRAFT_543020 [Xylaria palmicola]|nr:hypothetical protein F4802DRAFT_543020 [Xylaria palmicola]
MKSHEYPGLGRPLWYNPQEFAHFYPTGHHQECIGSKSAILQVREVAMMHIMDRLTDKESWHKKVFDDEIVAKWRAEALAYPDEALWNLAVSSVGWAAPEPVRGIMTEKAFDYCIQELRCKARHFEESGIVPTVDATAAVAKSDSLVPAPLADALREAFDRLMKDQAGSPDWHPKTDEKVLNLVHPSMYPLVYESTRLFRDEVVGVEDAVEKWAGKGDVMCEERGTVPRRRPGDSTVPPEFWSDNYQWLPSNVALGSDGSVKFTSYINNLHPGKYPEIYAVLEQLVEKVLPMWDHILGIVVDYHERDGAGREGPRLSLPDNPDDENEENWIPPSWEEMMAAAKRDKRPKAGEVDEDEEDIGSQDSEDEESEDEDYWREKWEAERQPVLREPDPFEEADYSPVYRLAQRFADTGLQIIVKMVSIELTPEKPSFPAGSWHVEGQMNEHICATALYYLDSENVTTSSLSFRMQTDVYLNDDEQFQVGQDAYSWLERAHGTKLGADGSCLQSYGNVETPQGRLLAFPNVFQHRVSPFQLADPTKPGHRRFVALWLVDPHLRVVSTANVPPQQADWWVDSVFGTTAESQRAALARLPAELLAGLEQRGLLEGMMMRSGGAGAGGVPQSGKLPAELVEMVRAHLRDLPLMSDEEARAHRLKLMEDRTRYNAAADRAWQDMTYNFCEH